MCNCGGTCETERLRAERDALKRQLAELLESTQWQSMETAPKDGSDFLAVKDGIAFTARWSWWSGRFVHVAFKEELLYCPGIDRWAPLSALDIGGQKCAG